MSTEQPKKKRGWKRWLVISIMGLCVLCTAASLIQEALLPPEVKIARNATRTAAAIPTETPTVTPTSEPTATPTTTNTPEPTKTPTITNTPEPTSTEPTATATPTEDAPLPTDVQAYFAEVSEYTTDIGTAMGNLGELMQDARYNDQDWILDGAVQIAIIRVSHEKINDIHPPTEVQHIQNAVLEATQDCYDMTFHLTTSIDNRDIDELNTATALMVSCGAKMKEPTKLTREYLSR